MERVSLVVAEGSSPHRILSAVERAISGHDRLGPRAVLGAKLRRARSLSAADWVALLRAATWLVAVRAGLRTTGFLRLDGRLERGLPAPSRPPDPARAARLAALVDIAARNAHPPATCLPRALVLRRLLRAEGLPAALRIGARRAEDGALLAHAWVESGGDVVGDAPDIAQRFAPLGPEADHLRALGARAGGDPGQRVYSSAPSDPAEEAEP